MKQGKNGNDIKMNHTFLNFIEVFINRQKKEEGLKPSFNTHPFFNARALCPCVYTQ